MHHRRLQGLLPDVQQCTYLRSSQYFRQRLHLQINSAVIHHKQMETEGLEITIYKPTPCMTLLQISMVVNEQKTEVTLQLLA